MKNPKKKKSVPATKAAIKKAVSAAGIKSVKITKIEPSKTVAVSRAAVRKTAAQAVRRKAIIKTIPEKYKKVLSAYGLGAASGVIKKRGRYYAAAGLFQIKKNKLSVKNKTYKSGPKKGQNIEEQNVLDFRNSDKKGWYIRIVNGDPQKKLARYNAVKAEQGRAFFQEKIRLVSAKTGLSKTAVRKIVTAIRKEEGAKLRRYKKTKKFKNLSKALQKKNTVHNRVTAVFGAMAEFLEVYASPKPLKEDESRIWQKNAAGNWQHKTGRGAWFTIPKKSEE